MVMSGSSSESDSSSSEDSRSEESEDSKDDRRRSHSKSKSVEKKESVHSSDTEKSGEEGSEPVAKGPRKRKVQLGTEEDKMDTDDQPPPPPPKPANWQLTAKRAVVSTATPYDDEMIDLEVESIPDPTSMGEEPVAPAAEDQAMAAIEGPSSSAQAAVRGVSPPPMVRAKGDGKMTHGRIKKPQEEAQKDDGSYHTWGRPLTHIEEPFEFWLQNLPDEQLGMLSVDQVKRDKLADTLKPRPTPEMRKTWADLERRKCIPVGVVLGQLLEPTNYRDMFCQAVPYMATFPPPPPVVYVKADPKNKSSRNIVDPESITTTPKCLGVGMAAAHARLIQYPQLPADPMIYPLLRTFPLSYEPEQLHNAIAAAIVTPPDKVVATDSINARKIAKQKEIQMRLFDINWCAEDLGLAWMNLGAARWATIRLLLQPPNNTERILYYPNMNSPECLLALRAAIEAGQLIGDGEFIFVGFDSEFMNTKWEPARLWKARDFLLLLSSRQSVFTEEVQQEFVEQMGYTKGWHMHRAGGDYRGGAPGRKKKRSHADTEDRQWDLSAEIRKAIHDVRRFDRIGLNYSELRQKGPYLAAVQVAAPGGLTFVAQPTDRSGRLAPEWVEFFNNPRIVKLMIAASQDNLALQNTYKKEHRELELTAQRGVFDVQVIYHWLELKRSGQLSALEFARMTMGILYRGNQSDPIAFKEAQQTQSWMPPSTRMDLYYDQTLYGGFDAILALTSACVLIATRPEFVYYLLNEKRTEFAFNLECHMATSLRKALFLPDDDSVALLWPKEQIHQLCSPEYEPDQPRPLMTHDLEQYWIDYRENVEETHVDCLARIWDSYLQSEKAEWKLIGNTMRMNLIYDFLLRRDEHDDNGIFGPIRQMYPFRDQREFVPGSQFGPYGTQSTRKPNFFVENAFSLDSLDGESVINLGFKMMKELEAHCNVQWLAEHAKWGRKTPRLYEQGAQLMEALRAFDFRRTLVAKAILWDRKSIPDVALEVKEMKNYNHFNRQILPHSKQRYQALARKLRIKAAMYPDRMISKRRYGMILDDAENVLHEQGRVGAWFWKMNGPTYEQDFDNYCYEAEEMINGLRRREKFAEMDSLRDELERVRKYANKVLHPTPEVEEIIITFDNPLATIGSKDRKRSMLNEYQSPSDVDYVDYIGNHERIPGITVNKEAMLIYSAPRIAKEDTEDKIPFSTIEEGVDGEPINVAIEIDSPAADLEIAADYPSVRQLMNQIIDPTELLRQQDDLRIRLDEIRDERNWEEKRLLGNKTRRKEKKARKQSSEAPSDGSRTSAKRTTSHSQDRSEQPPKKNKTGTEKEKIKKSKAEIKQQQEESKILASAEHYSQLHEASRKEYVSLFVKGKIAEILGTPAKYKEKRIAYMQLYAYQLPEGPIPPKEYAERSRKELKDRQDYEKSMRNTRKEKKESEKGKESRKEKKKQNEASGGAGSQQWEEFRSPTSHYSSRDASPERRSRTASTHSPTRRGPPVSTSTPRGQVQSRIVIRRDSVRSDRSRTERSRDDSVQLMEEDEMTRPRTPITPGHRDTDRDRREGSTVSHRATMRRGAPTRSLGSTEQEIIHKLRWFEVDSTFVQGRAEPQIDFSGRDRYNVSPNAIQVFVNKNNETGVEFPLDAEHKGFPICLLSLYPNSNPWIRIQLMSWVHCIRPTIDGEVYDPFSMGIDDHFYRDFATSDTKLRSKVEMVIPLAGLGGYRPTIEQLWRSTALLWLVLKFEQVFYKVSANDLANVLYFAQTHQVRAYWDAICGRVFTPEFYIGSPQEYTHINMTITDPQSARYALMEFIQAARLTRRNLETDRESKFFNAEATQLNDDELKWMDLRIKGAGDSRNYQIQHWKHAGEQDELAKTLQKSFNLDTYPFEGAFRNRTPTGHLVEAVFEREVPRQDKEKERRQYQQFRMIQVRPAEIYANYHLYCRAMGRAKTAKDNIAIGVMKETVRIDSTGQVNMEPVHEYMNYGRVALPPLALSRSLAHSSRDESRQSAHSGSGHSSRQHGQETPSDRSRPGSGHGERTYPDKRGHGGPSPRK